MLTNEDVSGGVFELLICALISVILHITSCKQFKHIRRMPKFNGQFQVLDDGSGARSRRWSGSWSGLWIRGVEYRLEGARSQGGQRCRNWGLRVRCNPDPFWRGTPSPSHNTSTGPMSFPGEYPGQDGGYPTTTPPPRQGWGTPSWIGK